MKFNLVYFPISKASQARRAKLEKVTEERDKVDIQDSPKLCLYIFVLMWHHDIGKGAACSNEEGGRSSRGGEGGDGRESRGAEQIVKSAFIFSF